MCDTINIELAKRFDAIRTKLHKSLRDFNGGYEVLLRRTLTLMFEGDEDDYDYDEAAPPDVANIHVIDDGHYQGTQLFLIPEHRYQPCNYYVTKVGYGSCSGCDTMLSILGYGEYNEETDEYEYTMDESQRDRLVTLALHMIQRMEIV